MTTCNQPMTTTIVPFGKYKGQLIEALAQDREYCEWLAGQDWFRTRYTTIHTLIVNNFGEQNETPEHNALQARFTDPAWIKAFMWAYLGPHWWSDALTRELARLRQVCDTALAQKQERIERYQGDSRESFRRMIEDDRLDIDQVRAVYQQHSEWLASGIVPHVIVQELTFENRGADVDLLAFFGLSRQAPCVSVEYLSNGGNGGMRSDMFKSVGWCHNLRVECKPTLGDDYPAVLRQMIANKSNLLLLGAGGYQGIGSTYEQVTKILGASGIKVVLLADVNG